MDILNQSFYLVTNGGFPLIRVPGGGIVCVSPPPTHTHTHHDGYAKLLIIKHSLTPRPPHTHTPVCEIINYQTFVHPPPPHRCAWGGGERGDRMFEQLGDSRSVWGWGICWRNVGG